MITQKMELNDKLSHLVLMPFIAMNHLKSCDAEEMLINMKQLWFKQYKKYSMPIQ